MGKKIKRNYKVIRGKGMVKEDKKKKKKI